MYKNCNKKNIALIIISLVISAILIPIKSFSQNDILNYYEKGDLAYRNNDYSSAKEYFKKSIKLNTNKKVILDSYNYLGISHVKTRDIFKAIQIFLYLEKEYTYSNNDRNLIINYLNINQCYRIAGGNKNIKKGRDYLLKGLLLAKKNKNKSFLLSCYLSIGQTYNTIDYLDVHSANKYFKKAYDLAKQLNDSLRLTRILVRQGNLYNTTNIDSSIYYLKKGLKYIPKDKLHLNIYNYSNLGLSYSKIKKFNLSNYYHNLALKHCYKNEINSISLLSPNNINNTSFKSSVLILLTQEFLNLHNKFSDTKNNSHLNEIIRLSYLSDNLIDLILIETTNKFSRLYWREKATEIYNKAIKACFLAKRYDDAFYFMEKNKALVLMEDSRLNQLKQQEGVPKHLKDSLLQINTSIYSIKQELKDQTKTELQRQLLALEETRIDYQDSIKLYAPKTKFTNTNIDIAKLNTVQAKLNSNQAILEYFVYKETGQYDPYVDDDKAGYAMLVTKDSIYPFILEDITKLKQQCQEFLAISQTRFGSIGDKNKYNTIANAIYNSILPNKTIQNLIKTKELTIVPDNYLSQIPFEALVDNNSQYLIENTEIHYAFSNSFLNQNKSDKSLPNTYSIAGYAPFEFKQDSTLLPLRNSIKEIEGIAKYINITNYSKEIATKQQFLKSLQDNNIIHLATHASTTDSISPWIAFHDDKLNLDELYLTQNNADLIVLSACKTNTGQLAVGEGVMSLSRGFFQTGTKSVVSSLWNANDKATASIMDSFYKHLKGGKTKSKALHLAKLEYLKSKSLSDASPYYWASFVLVGDAGKIDIPNSGIWYYIITGAFILALLLLFKLKTSGRRLK